MTCQYDSEHVRSLRRLDGPWRLVANHVLCAHQRGGIRSMHTPTPVIPGPETPSLSEPLGLVAMRALTVGRALEVRQNVVAVR